MNDFGIKISKEGKDVKACQDKDLILSSEFDTFKIGFSDRLTLTYPNWSYNYTGSPISRTDSAYFEHNLGYIPYYTPRCLDESAPSSPMGTGTLYINEAIQGGPLVNYSPPSWIRGLVNVYVTNTRLYIEVTREFNYATENESGTWYGGTVYMDYTIFRNSLSEEFNLLE